MKIAIMQPYLFPYIGYFQLINCVDKFVIYDDVHFINRGWINRNRILANNEANLFTIPLRKSSQNKLIRELEVSDNFDWRKKFLKKIDRCYKKAPYFMNVFGMISDVITNEETKISKIIFKSINTLKNYLNIDTNFVESSAIYKNSDIKEQFRIIDICKKEKAEQYINPVGGIELYSKKLFEQEGIKLNFIKSNKIIYRQFNHNFVDSLSIIDVLMFNSKDKTKKYLNEYELI